MTTPQNPSPKAETNEKLTEKVKNSVEQNLPDIVDSAELDKAVYKAERAVLENMTTFDNLKSASEEEIDRQIIHDEIDPLVKAEDRLTTAVHLKLFPEFIQYYLTSNKTKIKKSVLKQILRLIFSSFIASGKNTLEIIFPILEIIDSEEGLTSENLKKIRQELEIKIIFWLRQELIVPGDSPVKTMITLKKIVDDLNMSDKTINNSKLISNFIDKKISLIKLIKQCDLLTSEAKIRLIEKIYIFTNEEISQLTNLFSAEIDYGKSHKNLIIKEVLFILKELEENLITY
jgi:hypothetical protein